MTRHEKIEIRSNRFLSDLEAESRARDEFYRKYGDLLFTRVIDNVAVHHRPSHNFNVIVDVQFHCEDLPF